MSCYIVTYDLRKPGRNYNQLYEGIKSYATWAHITESVWAVVTTKSATEVRDYLRTFLDTDDRIFVVRSGTEAAWVNVICNNEWLKTNL